MPHQKEAEAVLAMWREIERALAKAEPGSPEAERLQTDATLLRDEYQRLIDKVVEQDDRAVSPAFPEATEAS